MAADRARCNAVPLHGFCKRSQMGFVCPLVATDVNYPVPSAGKKVGEGARASTDSNLVELVLSFYL